MNIVCAWCGKSIGNKDGEGINGVSHGVCETCYERLTLAAKEEQAHKIKSRILRIRSKRSRQGI